MYNIKNNIAKIKFNLPSHVKLIAVSKTKSNEAILEAYETGHKIFGENYIQELVAKQAVLPSDINWHFIGHLQSNKVKYIAPFIYCIHSVDSLKLLQEINKQAIKNNRKIKCLLQVYIAREETKFGLNYTEVEEILKIRQQLENVEIIGFMSMASNTNDKKVIMEEFTQLHQFYKLQQSQNPLLNELCIGMSNDYEIAIGCGATIIRIGSSIFGTRN